MGRDIAVTADPFGRYRGKRLRQRLDHGCQLVVLRRRIGFVVLSFQFDADGIIIARAASLKSRFTRMPGAHSERNVLHYFTGPPDQQMAGDAQVRNPGKIGVGIRIKPVGEQIIDPGPPVLTWRQTDTVDDNKGNVIAIRPCIEVG